jgi:hypothetical protein
LVSSQSSRGGGEGPNGRDFLYVHLIAIYEVDDRALFPSVLFKPLNLIGIDFDFLSVSGQSYHFRHRESSYFARRGSSLARHLAYADI